MSQEKKPISRREFLKGTTVGAAGIAATTFLGGCAPKVVDPEVEGSIGVDAPAAGPSAVAEREMIPQAYLNPQDYDYLDLISTL